MHFSALIINVPPPPCEKSMPTSVWAWARPSLKGCSRAVHVPPDPPLVPDVHAVWPPAEDEISPRLSSSKSESSSERESMFLPALSP